MAYSKSINIFLPSGSADGPIELEMLNWNGSVIKIPRKEVGNYVDQGLDCPGVYFLFCKEDNAQESVYVGEAENLLLRLKQHIQSHNAGKEKFFWQVAVCVSGKDLNKALIKFLEHHYCMMAKQSSKYELLTKKSSPSITLKRAEQAAMAEFTDNVNMLMGTIGYKILDTAGGVASKDEKIFTCKSKSGADASGYMSEDGFVVLPDSKVATEGGAKAFQESSYSVLYDKLVAEKVIVDGVFVKEYTFTSPTAAADVVMRSYVSGPLNWIDSDGKKLKDYEM